MRGAESEQLSRRDCRPFRRTAHHADKFDVDAVAHPKARHDRLDRHWPMLLAVRAEEDRNVELPRRLHRDRSKESCRRGNNRLSRHGVVPSGSGSIAHKRACDKI